jgi:integrase
MNSLVSPAALVPVVARRRRDGQPWLKQNASGYWVIHHSPGDGCTRRVSCKTENREEAERQLEQFRRRLAGEVDTDVDRLVSVNDVLDYYLTKHVERKANDVRRRVIALSWLRISLGYLNVEALSAERIEDYVDERRDGSIAKGAKPVGDGTIRYELNALVAAFNFAVDRKKLEANLMPSVALPDAPLPRDLWLDEKEASWLIDFVLSTDEPHTSRMTRLARFVLLVLGLGSRKAVIEAMRWEDVNLEEGLIASRQPPRRTGAQKSKKKQPPAMAIPDWLMPHLRRMNDERVDLPFVLDHSGDIRDAFDVLREKAFAATGNVKFQAMTPHTLRHTKATLLARNGASPWEISGILGSSLATVDKTYAHHCPDHLRTASNAWSPKPLSPDVEELL